MKVLHVIPSLDIDFGGPPRSTVGLCRALAAVGNQVTLLTRSAKGWSQDELQIADQNHGSLTTVCTDSIHAEGQRLSAAQDLVHMQSLWSVQNTRLARHCNKAGIPYLLAPRGELNQWSMQQKAFKKRVFLMLAGKRTVREAAALHVLNENEKNDLANLGLFGRYFVSPNGIEEIGASELPEPGEYRRAHPELADKVIILFLARLHRGKGAGLLAESYRSLYEKYPNTHLLICGPDYGERKNIERILSKAISEGRAACLGMVTGRRKMALLQDANIFSLPSYQEGHPRNVLEAALFGKALVISEECHCPEFSHGDAAQVVGLSIDEVSAGLERLITDDGLRRRIGDRAANIVREKFLWNQIASKLSATYDTCLSAPENLARI